MKFASYDLEISKEVTGNDWKDQRPLGISCAATYYSDISYTEIVHEPGQITKGMAQAHVQSLQYAVESDYTIVTWNGASFDFDVLAEESGMVKECAELCMNHIDLMLIVVAMRGHYLGLDKLANGLGVTGKLHGVTLKDGRPIDDMNGARAPELWAQGEYDAVLAYLGQDVKTTNDLVLALVDNGYEFRWTANSGRPNSFRVPKLYTVAECLALPRPDTSWMTDPPNIDKMVGWMNG